MSGRQVHKAGVFVLSGAMVVIGLTLVIEAFLTPSAIFADLLTGALFFAAGVGRFYVELRRGRRAP
jgi:hypothetical protein